jgi:hypothetical protein
MPLSLNFMDFKQTTLKELQDHAGRVGSKSSLVGLDGFVDTIVHGVAQRHGQGNDFKRIETITEFGERILAAAGKSTNIELYPIMEKLGGNGPIMANALLSAGMKTRYLGALGHPSAHGVFTDFAARSNAVSIANPGFTTAAEFTDGKIMLGNTSALDTVTFESIVSQVGEGQFLEMFSQVDLIALVNWTMIPNMTRFFNSLLDRVIPMIPPRDQRIWFFDLADPEKRSTGDIVTVLNTISRFQPHGTTTLGLNYSEAQQVCKALGLSQQDPVEEGLKTMAREIREKLHLGTVVVHPKDSAACATRAAGALRGRHRATLPGDSYRPYGAGAFDLRACPP